MVKVHCPYKRRLPAAPGFITQINCMCDVYCYTSLLPSVCTVNLIRKNSGIMYFMGKKPVGGVLFKQDDYEDGSKMCCVCCINFFGIEQ